MRKSTTVASTILVAVILCSQAIVAQDLRSNAAATDDFQYAKKLFKEGYFDLCISQLDAFMKRYPNAREIAESWRLTGEANFALGKYQDAETAFRTFEIRYPEHPEIESVRLRLADSQKAQGKLETAALTYERFVFFHPRSEKASFAQYHASRLWAQSGKRDRARQGIHRLFQAFPRSDERLPAHLLLVQTFIEEGNYPIALQEAERLFRSFPQKDLTAQAYFVRGRIQEHLGQFQLAEETYNEMLSRFSKGEWAVQAQERLAELAFARGEVKAATAHLETAAAEAPSSAGKNRFVLRAAEMNALVGQTNEARQAISRFDTTVADSASLLTYFYTLGMIQAENGETSSAAQAFGRAASLAATHDSSTDNGSSGSRDRGQYSFWRAAQLYFDLQQFDVALRWCRQYRRTYPTGPYRDALLLLEANIQRHGYANLPYAQRLYDQLLEEFPKSVYVDDAQFVRRQTRSGLGDLDDLATKVLF